MSTYHGYTPRQHKTASEKQVAFMKKLQDEYQALQVAKLRHEGKSVDADAVQQMEIDFHENLDMQEASRRIDRLIGMIKTIKETPVRLDAVSGRIEVEDGYYLVGGRVYKVQHAVHATGGQYAKVLDFKTGRFEYEAGAIRKVQPSMKLSVKEAAHYGKLYGRCIVCGRTLTDETSIERGIGPICEGRL